MTETFTQNSVSFGCLCLCEKEPVCQDGTRTWHELPLNLSCSSDILSCSCSMFLRRCGPPTIKKNDFLQLRRSGVRRFLMLEVCGVILAILTL